MRLRATHAGFSAAFALSCLLAAPQAHAQKYRVVDLGLGGTSGIASNGTVAGVAYDITTLGLHATLWATDGSRTLLGAWPGDIEESISFINDQGMAIGASYHYGHANQYTYTIATKFVWTSATGLQPLPWQAQHPEANPAALNNLGHIAGINAYDVANGYASLPPFLWTQDKGITFMQGNANFHPYSVNALNDQDMAVGGGARTGDPQASGGFVWTPAGGLKELVSPLKGFTDIIPTTVNADGLVAGFVRDWPTGRTKLFAWSAKSGVTILMPFTYYPEVLRPIGIDKTLRVVGNREFSYLTNGKGTVGFVWNILTGPRDINTLLVDNGPANAPIATVGALTGVNSQGQISAAALIDGRPHAVRLDPVR